MKILSVIATEPITWHHLKPDFFPCMVCDHAEATQRVTIKRDDLVLKLIACAGCVAKGNGAFDKFFKKVGKREK